MSYFTHNRFAFRLPETGEGFKNPDKDERGPWKSDPFQVGGWRPNQQYPIVNPKTGVTYYPNEGSSWKNDFEKFQELLADGRIVFGVDGDAGPYRKRFLSEAIKRGRVANTIWNDVKTTTHGTSEIKKLFGKAIFRNPKPTPLLKKILLLGSHKNTIIMDYFAGSGTTAHAVVNLNRDDGGRRKFILAEVGNYFNTVLMPRVKKVICSPEWKDGKPSRKTTTEEFERGPRLVKYQRIESYEDALGNIKFENKGGLALDNFTPRYELELTSRDCPTWLIDTGLEKPFTYSLELVVSSTEEGQPTRTETADLPETFAWLTGFRVKTQRVLMDGDRRYLVQHGTLKDRATTVIWRDIADWQETDYGRDCDFIKQNKLTEGADCVLLNGGTTLQHAESLNPLFGNAMFPKTTTP